MQPDASTRMITTSAGELSFDCDAIVIPLVCEAGIRVSLPEQVRAAAETLVAGNPQAGTCGTVSAMNVYCDRKFVLTVLVGLGSPGGSSRREVVQAVAKALKKCKDAKAVKTVVLLENATPITESPELRSKLCELPFLVSYDFNAYKTSPNPPAMREVEFVTFAEGFEESRREAATCAESALLARDLVNHPSMFMTPTQFCEEARAVSEECGLEIEVFEKQKIEELGMHSFLAVARGAVDEPRLLVLRHRGGPEGQEALALVGKGVMFDSGGYSLKSKMATMHDDMGGAAAVLGAMRAIALRGLRLNVVAVVAACKNMISGGAYVPGDILRSMNGKTIEMLNSDAEGRLTLADAITYSLRAEAAGRIIDIATLTGAAKTAVGGHTAAVLSNDDNLFGAVEEASALSCEKIWRLNADKELRSVLDSAVADLKSSNPGSTMGGDAIVPGLFIEEFVEGKPWVHIDMAPVNWLSEDTACCCKGGSGYGVSLLYQTAKVLAR